MTNQPTERGQWTSASAAERDRLCAGAHLACLGLPESTSEDAQKGREIHAWLHWHRGSGLTSQPAEPAIADPELAYTCAMMESKAVEDWVNRLPPEAQQYDMEVFSEQRFWVRVVKLDGSGAYDHSGQPDGVYIKGRWAKIVDTKSGWLEVTPPNSNEQLRDLAVLVDANAPLGLDGVEVEIIQPGAQKQPPCVYDRAALATARALMEKRVIASNDPTAKRTPHPDACRFCRAKGTSRCPESVGSVMSLAVAEKLAGKDVVELPSPELLYACLLAEPIIRVVKERAREALKANPDAIPGFKLEPNAPNKPITDPGACWARCSTQGMTLEQFMGCVKVGKGDLEDALKTVIRSKTGKKRVEGWTPLWMKLLDGITTEEPKEPSIKRITL